MPEEPEKIFFHFLFVVTDSYLIEIQDGASDGLVHYCKLLHINAYNNVKLNVLSHTEGMVRRIRRSRLE